jgi:methylthioribose-1-phosphate isomerase
LTAWELQRAGIPCHLIVDNAGGHLMQRGEVDLVIVGADRVSRRGDVCNKIGTYLKALAARDNAIPFYAAVPTPTIDLGIDDALKEIPIEERHGREVSHVTGMAPERALETIAIVSAGIDTHNPAFDVTPAELVTGILTEKGLVPASTAGIASLFA